MSPTSNNQFHGSNRPRSGQPRDRATHPVRFGSASSQPPTTRPVRFASIPTLPSVTTAHSAATPAVDEAGWFGTTDHTAAEETAGRSMAALVGRIIGAKPFPMSARRLADLTRMEVVRIEPVIQVLESDPGLSARLLRLVNSAGYALRQRCTSVRHAATLVGTDRLHQIATTAAVLDLFDSKGPIAAQIIEHSTVVGAFCRYLGAHLALPVDDLFTAGFLHDIGKLMLMETEGDRYVELLTRCASQPDSIHNLERSAYGFDHASLAAHVLTAWNIPDPVPKIVGWHHDPAHAYRHSSLMASLVQTVRLADTIVYVIRKGSAANLKELAEHEAARYLDISEPQLAAMWDELRVLFDECHQQCLGENAPALDPRSLRPRQPIVPTLDSVPSERASERANELPKQFPCVECGCPTFGNTCPACGGYVCPDHQVGSNEWCAICVRDYQTEKNFLPLLRVKWGFGALGAAMLLSGVLGMLTAGGAGALRAAFGTLMLELLVGLLYLIGRTWLLRKRFVRSRPNRSIPEAQLNDGGTQSLVPSMQPEVEEDSATSQSVNWLRANVHLVEPLKEITIREISGDHANSESAVPAPPDAVFDMSERSRPVAEMSPSSAIDPVRVQLQSESLVTLPAPAHPDPLAHTEMGSSSEQPPSTRDVSSAMERSDELARTTQQDESPDAQRLNCVAPAAPNALQHAVAHGAWPSSEVIAVAPPPSPVGPHEGDGTAAIPPHAALLTTPEACADIGCRAEGSSHSQRSWPPHHPLTALGLHSPPQRGNLGETESSSFGQTDAADERLSTRPQDPEYIEQQSSASSSAQPPAAPNGVDADHLLRTLAIELSGRFGNEFESHVRELAAQRVAQMIAERFMAAFDVNSLIKPPTSAATGTAAVVEPTSAPKPRKRKRQS